MQKEEEKSYHYLSCWNFIQLIQNFKRERERVGSIERRYFAFIEQKNEI